MMWIVFVFLLYSNHFALSTNIFVIKVLCFKDSCDRMNTVKCKGGVDMAADHGQNSFRRGVLSLVILALLKKEDMYGYQLVQETVRLSGGRIVTQEGSLYPVLYKLQEQGLISDHKVQVGKRMTRVYYHLEPEGEVMLRQLVQEYDEINRGVHMILDAEKLEET